MRAEGLYTGGPVRYGYRAVEKGRMNKKNKPVKDLEIDPEEAAIVKEVFERTVFEGAGSFVLANELNERGVRTHHGAKFSALKINRILAERQYTGYLITKDITSPFLPELQIISKELFDQAQVIVEQRKRKNADWRNIPRQNSTGALLGGNLYCATCGSRMTSSNPGKGAKREYAEYLCYMGANHRIECSGQRAYVAKRVDRLVIQVTRLLLDSIRDTPKDASVEKRMKAEIKALADRVREANTKARAAAEEQENLEREVAKSLMGKSHFNPEMLSRLIDEAARKKKELQKTAAELEQQLADQKKIAEKLGSYYDRFLGWSGEFGMASIERKRMIIAQLYKRIELGRGYNLHFVLDWNYEQFLNASVLENVKDVENASLQPPLKIKKQGRPRTGKTKKTA